jgi:hypothetical protein
MDRADIYRIVRAAHLGRTVRMVERETENYGSHDHLIPEDEDERTAFLIASTDFDIEKAWRDELRIARPPMPRWLVLD